MNFTLSAHAGPRIRLNVDANQVENFNYNGPDQEILVKRAPLFTIIMLVIGALEYNVKKVYFFTNSSKNQVGGFLTKISLMANGTSRANASLFRIMMNASFQRQSGHSIPQP